jgi:hypothetical protein
MRLKSAPSGRCLRNLGEKGPSRSRSARLQDAQAGPGLGHLALCHVDRIVAVGPRDDHDQVVAVNEGNEPRRAASLRMPVVHFDLDAQLGAEGEDFPLDPLVAADEADSYRSAHGHEAERLSRSMVSTIMDQ